MADTNTVIGQTILVKGNLQGDEDLTVQGRIEGAIHLTKTLIIEPTGVVKADVSVCNANISGIMVGNVQATDSVEISESGRMVGDIRAPRVIINEGALFKGQVDMGDLEVSRSASSEQRPQTLRAGSGRMDTSRRLATSPIRSSIGTTGKSSAKAALASSEAKAEAKSETKSEQKSEKSSAASSAGHAVASSKKKVVVKKRR
jgi:cytoskeletal protein CcmA (bactofilin family)